MSVKYVSLLMVLFFAWEGKAQEQSPQLLSSPESWRFERIDFPLSFAPEIDWKGFEELRFAPGMFDRAAEDYFTYAFVLSLDESGKLSGKDLEEFLVLYYRGLSLAVAKSKEQKIDEREITVEIKTKSSNNYTAKINFLDTFNKGEKVSLFADIEVIQNKATNKTYVVALVSSNHDRKSSIWSTLYGNRNKWLIGE